MNVQKTTTQLIHKVGQAVQPTNAAERQQQRLAAIGLAIIATLALLWRWFT